MKKIDKLLIKGFIPPFIVTFMIAIFVLLMQFLWLYIDDIAGKGLGIFVIFELLAYKSVGLIPLATPLAILISSVMVFGNMGERYELSSFKSGGVSLLRIMAPIVFIGIIAAFGSFFSSNNLLPVANLKFGTRMWDIRHQKPSLNLEAGVFNDDFKGFAIHIGEKNPDGHRISDVLIYDHSDASKGLLREIVAKEGEMYSSDDGKYFVLNLKNGNQYVEQKSKRKGKTKGKSYPFVRTKFKTWTKLFDLGEFEMAKGSETSFEKHRKVQNASQLKATSDSIAVKIEKKAGSLYNYMANYFSFMKLDSAFVKKAKKQKELPIDMIQDPTARFPKADTKPSITKNKKQKTKGKNPKKAAKPSPEKSKKIIAKTKVPKTKEKFTQKKKKRTPKKPKKKRKKSNPTYSKPLTQQLDSLDTYTSIAQAFTQKDLSRLLSKARNSANNIFSQAKSTDRTLLHTKEMRVKVIYDLHSKFSFAVICFIFIFIGAPMGAMVRKGGFGYPVLIAIVFFITFIIGSMASKKIAETFTISAELAAWLPCLAFLPVGLLFTYMAMSDSKLFKFG